MTADVAHVAGPWLAISWRTHSPTTVVRVDENAAVCVVAEVIGDGYSPQTIATARLIAAAPGLLELAKQYANECGECAGVGIDLDDRPCRECAQIRALIAQASPLPSKTHHHRSLPR